MEYEIKSTIICTHIVKKILHLRSPGPPVVPSEVGVVAEETAVSEAVGMAVSVLAAVVADQHRDPVVGNPSCSDQAVHNYNNLHSLDLELVAYMQE